MAWGHIRGARHVGMRVAADNMPALALYRSVGCDTELCRYRDRLDR